MKSRFFLSLLALGLVSLQPICLFAAEGSSPSGAVDYEQIQDLRKERKWKELIAALRPDDLSTVSGEIGGDEDSLYFLRGEAHMYSKDGVAAEADFMRAIEKGKEGMASAGYWVGLANNRRDNLKDFQGAYEAYLRVLDLCFQAGNRNGFMPIQCTIDAAAIQRNEGKYEEALTLLQRYESQEGMAPVWRMKVLRAFAEVYLAQGKEEAAADCLQRASTLEAEIKSGMHK